MHTKQIEDPVQRKITEQPDEFFSSLALLLPIYHRYLRLPFLSSALVEFYDACWPCKRKTLKGFYDSPTCPQTCLTYDEGVTKRMCFMTKVNESKQDKRRSRYEWVIFYRIIILWQMKGAKLKPFLIKCHFQLICALLSSILFMNLIQMTTSIQIKLCSITRNLLCFSFCPFSLMQSNILTICLRWLTMSR